MRLILGVVILATAVGVSSAGSASTTRFHLKDGEALSLARLYFENSFNRQPTIDGTVCRFTDGSPLAGWLSVACTGRNRVGGAIHRFSAVYTPVTCTSLRLRLHIAGVIQVTRRVNWPSDSPVQCHAD